MKPVKFLLTIAALPVLLTYCGGGGGGGGGTNSRGVRVLHGAIDAAPTDFTSSADPTILLGTASFGESTGYIKVPDGQQNLVLTVRGDSVITTGATVSGDDKLSLVLVEADRNHVYSASLIGGEAPEVGSTEAAFRIIHAVRGVDELGLTINSTASSAERAQASSYVVVPAGAVTVVASSNGARVYAGTVSVAGGSAYSLLITGEAGYFVGGRLLQD